MKHSGGDINFRFKTTYSKCPNLSSILKADLMRKINKGLIDENFKLADCHNNQPPGKRNCKKSKYKLPFYKDNPCKLQDQMCQTSGAIYAISCPIENCNKKYFGSSKRKIKERIGEHIGDSAKLLEPNAKSKDSFTRHLKDNHGDEFFDMVYDWVVNPRMPVKLFIPTMPVYG